MARKVVEKSRAATKIAVTFDEADLTFLRKRAEADNVSLSSVIRDIVSSHVGGLRLAAPSKPRRSVI